MEEANSCLQCGIQNTPLKLHDNGFSFCKSCLTELTKQEQDLRRSKAASTPDHIIDNIYLGAETAQYDLEILKSLNIIKVLSVLQYPLIFHEDILEYKVLDVDDSPSEDLRKYFEESFIFIHSAREGGGNVLVHCVSGISRSATVVIAYCMKEKGMTFEEAESYVKERRTCIMINSGFRKQLQLYEQELNN